MSAPTFSVAPSKMSIGDTLSTGVSALAGRKLRTLLSALGIAIGVASLVAVTGLSASNRASLLADLDELGTDLLTAEGSFGFDGRSRKLPSYSADQVARVAGVDTVASTRDLGVSVRRSPDSSRGAAPGVDVLATQPSLADVVSGSMAAGRFLDDATARFDNVVLGAVAADRLGIFDVGTRVSIDGRWFNVIGVLEPLPLAPEVDASVFMGDPAARRYIDAAEAAETDLEVDRLYMSVDPDSIEDVRSVLPSTLRPTQPAEVGVARPSDALRAQALAESAFSSLLLGLGAVALVVGGIGVANVMVIAVIERRGEIGLRRSLGATRVHIRRQFLTEALLLSLLGGALGVGLGVMVTAGWADAQGWILRIPPAALVGGLAASVVVGVIAGLYPAVRASRLAPTDALRS